MKKLFLLFSFFFLLAVTVHAEPKAELFFINPPEANKPFSVKIIVTENNNSVIIKDIKVSFNMHKMNMGNFSFIPVYDNASYTVNGILLPRCMSGSKDWFADIEYEFENKHYQTQVEFKLQ